MRSFLFSSSTNNWIILVALFRIYIFCPNFIQILNHPLKHYLAHRVLRESVQFSETCWTWESHTVYSCTEKEWKLPKIGYIYTQKTYRRTQEYRPTSWISAGRNQMESSSLLMRTPSNEMGSSKSLCPRPELRYHIRLRPTLWAWL